MVESSRIVKAEAEVERTRAQLIDTVQGLAAQLEPRKLAREFWESAKNKGADLAEDAVDAVTKRPVVATGLVAALAMFLARDPIKGATRKVAGAIKSPAKTKKTAPARPDKPEPPAAPPARRRAGRRAATRTEK